MKKKLLFLTGLIISASVAFACLNEHHVNKQGNRLESDYFVLEDTRFYKKHNKAELEKKIAELLEAKPADAEDSLWNQNSLAVNYIKLGKLDEAERILNSLMKKYPNDYSVIINLGTLYELRGKNKQALDYIKKAMIIDPDSHAGSEWFHVRILEFKLKNLPESSIPNEDILKLLSRKGGAASIAGDVSYQLQERIPFTPAPNLLMAKVLQEFGDYLADSVSIKGAYVMYEVGMDYDKDNLFRFAEKRDSLLPYFKEHKEVIPKTGIYYVDGILSTIEETITKDPIGVIEKGIDFFQDREKERRREQQQKTWLIIGAIAVVTITGLLIYRSRRRA